MFGMTIDVAPRRPLAAAQDCGSRRLLVVFNPAAGRKRRPRYEAVLAALRNEGCAVTAVETTAPGHAEQLARDLAPMAFDVIVAAGGDGTINEIVNGLGDKAVALGLIPLGTANVLADELKIPRKPAAIAHVLAHGAPVRIYTGLANGRRFCMMAGVGFDARVVAGVSLPLKKKLGPLAYVVQTAKLAFSDAFAANRITIDGVARETVSAVVSKGRYYGGPFVAVREATVTDDRLHVILMHGRGPMSVIRYGLALMMGRLAKLGDVEIAPAKEIAIAGEDGAPVQADGDIITHLPVRISVDSRPLAVISPKLT